jgi:hypothetical protein
MRTRRPWRESTQRISATRLAGTLKGDGLQGERGKVHFIFFLSAKSLVLSHICFYKTLTLFRFL